MSEIKAGERDVVRLALFVALVMSATIAGAWGFQILGNLAPCPLCLEQRIPYYTGIPVAFAAAVLAMRGANALATTGLLVLFGILFWSAGLGIYHAGGEWGYFTLPATCGTAQAVTGNAGNLLAQMQKTVVVACNEAAFRFLGVSLAGYNALISLALAGLTGLTLLRRVRSAPTAPAAAYGSSSVSQ